METEENPPLAMDGHIQWKNLPIWGKWIGGAVASFLLAVLPVMQLWRAGRAEEQAKAAQAKAHAAEQRGAQAKDSAEGGYQALRSDVEMLKAWKHEREEREQLAAAVKRKGQHKRPIAVIAVPAPRPLPPSLNAALETVKQARPIIVPTSPAPDAGQ